MAAAGCGPQAARPAAIPQPANALDRGEPARAQPRLPTVKVWLGTNQITAEVAKTPNQIQTGMMFRKSIGEDDGMLFVFTRPHRASFWMKNVTVPLSPVPVAMNRAVLCTA